MSPRLLTRFSSFLWRCLRVLRAFCKICYLLSKGTGKSEYWLLWKEQIFPRVLQIPSSMCQSIQTVGTLTGICRHIHTGMTYSTGGDCLHIQIGMKDRLGPWELSTWRGWQRSWNLSTYSDRDDKKSENCLHIRTGMTHTLWTVYMAVNCLHI